MTAGTLPAPHRLGKADAGYRVNDVMPKRGGATHCCRARRRSRYPFLAGDQNGPQGTAAGGRHPGIELVAAEAAEAGAERLVIITSEGKDGVVAHFVEDLVLESTLEERGKTAMLDKVRRARD